MVWTHVFVTGIWGGVMALERRAFLQASVSRPLVAGTITGLLLDDPLAGLYIGVLFELLHLGGASLGGAHADHETLPAIAAVAMAACTGNAMGGDAPPEIWAVSVLLLAPTGRAGALLEVRLDQRARKYFGRVRDSIEAGDFRRASRQNLRAMWPQFVFYGLICASASALGYFVMPHFPLSHALARALKWTWPAMGVAAAAVAVQGTRANARLKVAGASAALTFLLAFGAWYLGRRS